MLAILAAALLVANLAFWVWNKARVLLTADALSDLPPVMLWAWERPEDLGFLDCEKAGVAFLAKTILLDDRHYAVAPRVQPLKTPPGCPVVAVVRIEAGRAALDPSLVDGVVAQIAEVAGRPGLAAVQVDFDALESQRPFYRRVLQALRERLPAPVKLSITALASWCIFDDWISDLPIDEAVPMLFRMGPDRREVLRYLSSGRDFRVALCRHSLGISTAEGIPEAPSGRRVYVFHPRSWSPETVSGILSKVESWP